MGARTLDLYVVSPPGLESALAAELHELGIEATAAPGGIELNGDAALMRRLNLHLRCATRVLLRLSSFRARTFFELERHAARVPWTTVLTPGARVALRVTSKKSKLYHERAIAERLERALAERAGARLVENAPEDDDSAVDAQLIVVRVLRDEFTISADSSGDSLHRRGYRQAVAKAPLRENIAAALLHYAGWRGDRPLIDPMCGAGTIPIEAALRARRIAPGIASAGLRARAFAFTHWRDHDETAWQRELEDARAIVLPRALVCVCGSDRDAGAIQGALGNAERAGVSDDVEWRVAALSTVDPPEGAALVTNPPYGVRVSEGADLRDLFAALGRFVRERVHGGAALLSPDRALETQLGVRARVAAQTRNGGIPVRVLVLPPTS